MTPSDPQRDDRHWRVTTAQQDAGPVIGTHPETTVEIPYLLVVLVLGTLLAAAGLWFGRGALRARETARTAQLELGGGARRTLLKTDDALRTAERELGYARATFGADEAASLASALEAARVTVDGAFALGRQIDDEVDESTRARTAMLDRIVADCTSAQTTVDAQVARIAELRAIAADPAAAIADTATQLAAQAASIDQAAAALGTMRARYAGSSIRGVVAMPAEALASLAGARQDLERARDASSPQAAAVAVRSANVAIARSRELTVATERQAELLAASADRLGHLRDDAVAAIDAAQAHLDDLARSTSGTDPAAHELTLAGERLTAARTSLQEADAALAASPSDVQAATNRLTGAVTLAGAAANALTSVDASRDGAERAYGSAVALASETIAQGEAWLKDGRAPTTDERRLRATLGSARTMLANAAMVAPLDPVRATAMAWTAHHHAALAAAELDPDRVLPASHEGHSPARETAEEIGDVMMDVVAPALAQLALEFAVAVVIGGVASTAGGSRGGLGGGHSSSSGGGLGGGHTSSSGGGLGGGRSSGSGSGLGGGHHGSGGF